MRLRYYADNYDEEENRETVELLRQVDTQTDINLEVTRVTEEHDVDYSVFDTVNNENKSEVYNRDFSRNQTLSDNLGDRTPSQEFKNGQGTRKQINGKIAITDDSGNLLWATPRSGRGEDGRANYAVNFLESVAIEGIESVQNYLDSLESDAGPPVEKVIQNQFARSDVVPEPVEKEVEVGQSVVRDKREQQDQTNRGPWVDLNPFSNLATRNVDIVARGPETHWIVEVKREYSAGTFDKALGQVIVSDELYRSDNDLDASETQKAVVFGQLQQATEYPAKRRMFGEVVEIAERHDVQVYVGVDDGVYKQVTTSNFEDIPAAHWE